MNITRVSLVAALVLATLLHANGVAKKDIAGSYVYNGGTIADATVVICPEQYLSKRGPGATDHPVGGIWRFKRAKQEITMRWPDAAFTGTTVSANLITGTYTRIGVAPCAATLDRSTTQTFHLIVNRLTSTKLFGATIFNPGVRFPYGSYKVAVYAWSGGFGSLQPLKPFKRLGFFRSKLPSYSTAEAYLITNSFVPPPVLPAPMAVDGTNVFAYDWQTNGFKWFDFSTTNNPALF